MEEFIIKELLSKGIIVMMLAYAAYYFFKRDVEKQRRDDERHAQVEARFETLRGEREQERIQLLSATNQLVDVLRENTNTMKQVQSTLTETQLIIERLMLDLEAKNGSSPNSRKKAAQA